MIQLFDYLQYSVNKGGHQKNLKEKQVILFSNSGQRK